MKPFLSKTLAAVCALTAISCSPLNRPLSWMPENPFRGKSEISLQRQKLLAAGDYLGVLHLSEGRAKETDAKVIQGAYTQALMLMTAEKYADAGEAFAFLVPFAGKEGAKGSEGLITREQLSGKVTFCAEQLLVQGMSAYREGRLEEAIATWERILVFSPGHEAALKSLRTSRIQLSNLRLLEKQSP